MELPRALVRGYLWFSIDMNNYDFLEVPVHFLLPKIRHWVVRGFIPYLMKDYHNLHLNYNSL